MDDTKVVYATMWLMVIAQTIGSVDLPGEGERKLPAPRQYVAIIVLWSILGMLAEIGGSIGRTAARLSLLVTLTGMVVGPFGARIIALINGVSSNFATPPPAPATNTTSAPVAGTTLV